MIHKQTETKKKVLPPRRRRPMAAEAIRTTLSFNKEEILSRQPFKSF